MKVLKVVAGVLLLLGGLLLIAMTFLSADYRVERAIVIDAAASCPFDHVNDVEKHDAWSPFKAMEPTLDITYGEVTVGSGASYDWHGEMGNGRLTLLDSSEDERIQSVVWSPDMGDTDEEWTFTPEGSSTLVRWSYTGTVPGAKGPLMAAAMDPMLGGIFEDGLARLKEACEG
ncbi:MAG: SRPBCC family protein [Proteobacteria bacterium]|nr:SRPBCC family protein [Pseudomonadota bacterium]MCP4915779.1 SRPBCC family protein [Pseudomonadota bacterium]